MTEVSKNDVVGFATQILQMQKRIDELDRVNAATARMVENWRAAILRLKAEIENLAKETFPPGQIDVNARAGDQE